MTSVVSLALVFRVPPFHLEGMPRLVAAGVGQARLDSLARKYTASRAAMAFIQAKFHDVVTLKDVQECNQWAEFVALTESEAGKVFKHIACPVRHPGVCQALDGQRIPLFVNVYSHFRRFFKSFAPALGDVEVVAISGDHDKCIVGLGVFFKLKPQIICFVPCQPVRAAPRAYPGDLIYDRVGDISFNVSELDGSLDCELVPRHLTFLGTDIVSKETTVWQPLCFAKKLLQLGEPPNLSLKRLHFELVDCVPQNKLRIRCNGVLVAGPLVPERAKPVKVDKPNDEEAFSEMLDRGFRDLHSDDHAGGDVVHPVAGHGRMVNAPFPRGLARPVINIQAVMIHDVKMMPHSSDSL